MWVCPVGSLGALQCVSSGRTLIDEESETKSAAIWLRSQAGRKRGGLEPRSVRAGALLFSLLLFSLNLSFILGTILSVPQAMFYLIS